MQSDERARELNLRGSECLSRGDFAGAIAAYEQALTACPPAEAAEVHYNLGTARHMATDASGALADFNRAIELAPEFAEAFNNRGMTKQAQGDLAGALADFSQAIVAKADYAEAYNNRGTVLAGGGDRGVAVADFSRAIELEPAHARAFNNRGVVLQSQGDLPAALSDFDRAIAINPAYAEAWANRGTARQQVALAREPIREQAFTDQATPQPPARVDLSDAIADFDQAIKLTPRESAAGMYHNRGAARQAQGDLAGALNDFNEALSINPAHAATHANRGTVHKALRDLPAALADLDRAVAMMPRPSAAAAYHNRGGVRSLLNDFTGAVADYDSALEINPNLLVAYLSRGNARYHLRDPRAFVDHFHVLKLVPALAIEELLNILVNDCRRDATALLRNCNIHVRRNPDDVLALCRRGLSLLMLKHELPTARADLEKVWVLVPDLVQPLKPIVDAARALGERGVVAGAPVAAPSVFNSKVAIRRDAE